MMQVIISPQKEACSDEIDEMVRRIAERFDPDQIILIRLTCARDCASR